MKRLDLFIIKSYLGPLVLTFFISLFILVMQFLWKYVDDLVGKGLEWYVIAELLFYASSTFVPLALPLAILLSSLMTFGNLGEQYELVAMKASGISLRRIMKPLVVLSVIISLAAFLFSNNILPIANLKFGALLYDVRQQKLTLNIKEGVFYNGLEGFTIRINDKNDETNTIRDVMIYNHADRQGNIKLTTARHGKMEIAPDKSTLLFHLYEGFNYEDVTNRTGYQNTRPFQKIKFGEQTRRFSGLEAAMNRTDEELFRNNYQMMNLQQLTSYRDSLEAELILKEQSLLKSINERFVNYAHYDTLAADTAGIKPVMAASDTMYQPEKVDKNIRKAALDFALQSARSAKTNLEFSIPDFEKRRERIRKHDIEWHRKFTLSIACLILFFIGAPLGAIIRKGGLGMPVVVSILFFVIYHIISITGEKYARAGVLEPYIAMWLASAILLPVGIFLTYKATTDSPLLDAEAWNKIMRNLLFFVKQKQ
ncbi:MAG: YjgP/YjgQ family permease [Clostridia bacterium]|nr:YjgP/YjgQ family permease [Clostridia bacterium]